MRAQQKNGTLVRQRARRQRFSFFSRSIAARIVEHLEIN
jgi:hypothetical protein